MRREYRRLRLPDPDPDLDLDRVAAFSATAAFPAERLASAMDSAISLYLAAASRAALPASSAALMSSRVGSSAEKAGCCDGDSADAFAEEEQAGA
mmetsp:Transcript_133176/g.249050  ORF Transcript_133176/g.249050 Transcript_133176/m.249050 type:complete len:95 (+) Transcript_133176:813-1097(+)